MITEQQYQRLIKEHAKSGVLGTAAMKAGMHRETAAKYLAAGQGPQPEKRRGRRRPDPLTTIWADAERLLNDAPELEAKALFEHLLAGGAAPEAQNVLRTFQRGVLSWQRHHGPPKEVFFPQARQPGGSLQLDWTHAAELGVTIAGQKWEQLLCHVVLPYCERTFLTGRQGAPVPVLCADAIRRQRQSKRSGRPSRREGARRRWPSSGDRTAV